jgi:hypothetical protein
MDITHYDSGTNKMYTFKIVSIYRAPHTCSDVLATYVASFREIKRLKVIQLLYYFVKLHNCIICELFILCITSL